MSDLNDLTKPSLQTSYTDVPDTLLGHITRLWKMDYTGMASLVAGMVRASFSSVTGGLSMRVYRRNAANSAEDEVVSFPSVSIGGSAGSVNWSGVSGHPTKLSEFSNDKGFVDSSSIPTKVSQLTNDSNYVNSTSAQNLSFGYNQTWTYLTANRLNGTTYYNTTGKPIQVIVTGQLITGGYINGVRVNDCAYVSYVNMIVPPSASYMVTTSGGAIQWYELR